MEGLTTTRGSPACGETSLTAEPGAAVEVEAAARSPCGAEDPLPGAACG